MKCLGIHLGSIEMSTQPVTPAKVAFTLNKNAHNNRHIAGRKNVVSSFQQRVWKSFKVWNQTLAYCFLCLPWLLASLWVLCAPPSCLMVWLVFRLKTITTLTFIHPTWCCVCVCSIQGRAGVQCTARDNYTVIKGRRRFPTESTFWKGQCRQGHSWSRK